MKSLSFFFFLIIFCCSRLAARSLTTWQVATTGLLCAKWRNHARRLSNWRLKSSTYGGKQGFTGGGKNPPAWVWMYQLALIMPDRSKCLCARSQRRTQLMYRLSYSTQNEKKEHNTEKKRRLLSPELLAIFQSLKKKKSAFQCVCFFRTFNTKISP